MKIEGFCKYIENSLKENKELFNLSDECIRKRVYQFLKTALDDLQKKTNVDQIIKISRTAYLSHLRLRRIINKNKGLNKTINDRVKNSLEGIEALIKLEQPYFYKTKSKSSESREGYWFSAIQDSITALKNIVFEKNDEWFNSLPDIQKEWFGSKLLNIDTDGKKFLKSIPALPKQSIEAYKLSIILELFIVTTLEKLKDILKVHEPHPIDEFLKKRSLSKGSSKIKRETWLGFMNEIKIILKERKMKADLISDYVSKIFYGLGIEKSNAPDEVKVALGKVGIREKKKSS